MSEYAATFDQEEAPYIPTHGEFKLDSGYSVKIYTPVKLGSQDTDEESNKYWVLPYDDTGYTTSVVGITLENRFKTGYIDYDVYSIAEGIGGYAPDIKLAVQGGPIPMKNYCAAATTMNQIVSPHPSGFTDWITGRAILGKVKEQGAPTGEQCLVYLDPEPACLTLPALDTIAEAVDVTITAAADGDILKHNGTVWVDVVHNVDNITDTTITSGADFDTLMLTGSAWINVATTTENLTSPDVGGDDPIFNTAGNTPLLVYDVFDVTNQLKLYSGNPVSVAKTYSVAGTGFTVHNPDAITGLVVTYKYDANA